MILIKCIKRNVFCFLDIAQTLVEFEWMKMYLGNETTCIGIRGWQLFLASPKQTWHFSMDAQLLQHVYGVPKTSVHNEDVFFMKSVPYVLYILFEHMVKNGGIIVSGIRKIRSDNWQKIPIRSYNDHWFEKWTPFVEAIRSSLESKVIILFWMKM